MRRRRPSALRVAAWATAGALLAPWPLRHGARPEVDPSDSSGAATTAASGGRPPRPSLTARLLGPIASLAASAEWVRYDLALEAGDYPLAYERAERALALDPHSPHGWDLLGSHLVFLRGGALLEENPARRVEWMQAGLDVLSRGAQRSRAPASLHMVRGQILALFIAELANDPAALPWPGGERAALAAGIAAFDQAHALGHPKAHERKHQAQAAALLRAGSRAARRGR